MDIFHQKLDQLNKEAKEFPLLTKFEEKTGVKPIFLVLGGALIIILMVMSGFLASLLANLTGFLYPAFKSIKALESVDRDDDRQWLTYWTVYGLFVIVDDWASWVTGLIPQYYLIKLVFLIWLFAPTTKGAMFLYNKIIKDLFSKYSPHLDKAITKVVGEYQDFYDKAKKNLSNPDTIIKVAQVANKFEEKVTNRKTEGPGAPSPLEE